MKKMGIGMLVAALLASVAAWAENGGVDHFSAADENGDGVLASTEIEKYYQQVFKAMDTTGDGYLDRDECDYACVMFKPGVPLDIEKHGRQEEIANKVKSQFSLLDVDGSDLLSEEEYLGYFKKQMMQRDADRNRIVSRKEYDAK